MYVEKNNEGMSNSILKPFLHLNQYPHITFDSEIDVKMKKLDDFIEENKDLKISLEITPELINMLNFVMEINLQQFRLTNQKLLENGNVL